MSAHLPSRRSWPQRAGALLASTAFALLLAEGGFRLHAAVWGLPARFSYAGTDQDNLQAWLQAGHVRDDGGNLTPANAHDPVLGWIPRPDLRRLKVGGVLSPFSTNSLGMRGRTEFALAKPEGVNRVALIGDSFTFGLDKPDRRIWARLLADGLSPHEVLNFGVSGYGTDQACLSLSDRAVEFAPDVIVWGVFVYNPVRSSMRFTFFAKPWFSLGDGELELHGVPVPTPDDLVERHGTSGPLLYTPHYARRFLAARAPDPESDPDRYMLQLNRAILDRGRAVAEDSDAELLVVLIPKSDWTAGERTPVERDVLAWAAETDCPLLDLREIFGDRMDGAPAEFDLVHYVPDYHFSIEGHRVVAEVVAQELEDRGWLAADEH